MKTLSRSTQNQEFVWISAETCLVFLRPVDVPAVWPVKRSRSNVASEGMDKVRENQLEARADLLQ